MKRINNEETSIATTYFEKFSCIGPACEDTCCAGWKLSVDKRTFQMYRKVTSGSIAKDLRTNVTKSAQTHQIVTTLK